MVEVTQDELQAVARFVEDYGWLCEDEWSDIHPNDRETIGNFIAARNAALEEAAKAVERELALTAVANSEASSEWIDGFEFAWERVKAAIRNLKGPSNA